VGLGGGGGPWGGFAKVQVTRQPTLVVVGRQQQLLSCRACFFHVFSFLCAIHDDDVQLDSIAKKR
jgi:hypothetical protein